MTVTHEATWVCPECGAMVRDRDLIPGVHVPVLDPPVHVHQGERVELVYLAEGAEEPAAA